MRIGSRLVALARARGERAVAVVGTGKGVGKSTVLRAIYEAAHAEGLRPAILSVGFAARFPLRAGTLFATARALLPPAPAVEILGSEGVATPAGPLLFARAMHDGAYDVVGPSTNSGLREAAAFLAAGSDLLLLDGAIDRLAMLAACEAAIVVACGPAGAKSASEAIAEVAALTARLRVPRYDPEAPVCAIAGALTATGIAELIRRGETRQVVVGDATQILASGAALAQALASLTLRCRRSLRAIAATVCALSPERSFEPGEFLQAVAAATRLPAFDCFAGAQAS